MLHNNSTKYEILTPDKFEQDLKNLEKKYPHIRQVYEEYKKKLESGKPLTQNFPIPGYQSKVWKLRLPNPDADRGKSGGFRLIYQKDESKKQIIMLLIDSKPTKEKELRSKIDKLII